MMRFAAVLLAAGALAAASPALAQPAGPGGPDHQPPPPQDGPRGGPQYQGDGYHGPHRDRHHHRRVCYWRHHHRVCYWR